MIATVQQVYVSQADQGIHGGPGTGHAGERHPPAGRQPAVHAAAAARGQGDGGLEGRDFVLPDDVVSVAEAVLAHRIILDRKAASAGRDAAKRHPGGHAKIPACPERRRRPAERPRPAAVGGARAAAAESA